MFGQPSTPFASPSGTTGGAGTPFGAPSTGGSAFGAPSSAPFGSSTPGTSMGGFGGFGSPAPAPSGFGGFGSTSSTTGTTSSGFGGFGSPPAGTSTTGTSVFGAPSTSSTPFGAPAPSTGLFVSAPAPSGGLFGGGGGGTTTSAFGSSTTPSTGFGFGSTGTTSSTSTTPAFGATTSTFGSTAPAPTSTGLFGGAPSFGSTSTGPTTSVFGAPAPSTGGLFGSTTTHSSGGLFGAPAAAAKPGTLAYPYQATTKTDGQSSISLQAITAMPQYENKSFEELRFEDYSSGNRGSYGQSQPGTTTGGFGAGTFGSSTSTPGTTSGFGTTSSGGLFGSAPTPAPTSTFGSTATSTFGGSSAFGSPSAGAPGVFGASAPAPSTGGFTFGASAPSTGGFGSMAPKTSLFGSAPAPTGGLFGASAPAPSGGGLFGLSTSAPAPSGGGLFGSSSAPAPSGGLFGAPAPAPSGGGLFGAPAPSPSGGIFGAPSPTPAPSTGGLFGAPAPAPSGGLFGAPAPAPSGGLFGAPAPGPATYGGLFGAPAPAPSGGLFGARPPGGGLFGAPTPSPGPGGGLFGASAPFGGGGGGGLFGVPAPAAPAAPSYAPPAPMTVAPPTADVLLAQQLAAIENQKKELELLEAWRGNVPRGSSVIPYSLSERDASVEGWGGGDSGFSSYSTSLGTFSTYRAAPRSAVKIRPRGFGPMSHSPVSALGGGGGSPLLSPDAYLGSSAKRLVIKPGSLTPKPKMRLLLSDGDDETGGSIVQDKSGGGKRDEEIVGPRIENGDRLRATTPGAVTPSRLGIEKSTSHQKSLGGHQTRSGERNVGSLTLPADKTGLNAGDSAAGSPNLSAGEHIETSAEKNLQSALKKKASPSNGDAYDFYRQVIASPEETEERPSVREDFDDSRTEIHIGQTRSSPRGRKNLSGSTPKLTKKGYDMYPSVDTLSKMTEADLAAVSGFRVERPGYGSVSWDGAVDVRGVDLDSVVCIESRDVAVYDVEETDGTKPPLGCKLNRPAVITMYEVFPKDGPDASTESKEKFERKIIKSTKKMGAELISYDASSGVWKFRVQHFSRYGLTDDSDDDEDEYSEGMVNRTGRSKQDFESAGTGRPSRGHFKGGVGDGTDHGQSRTTAPVCEDEEMSERTRVESLTRVFKDESTGKGVPTSLKNADAAYEMLVAKPSSSSTYGGRRIQHDTQAAVKEKIERRKASRLFPDEGDANSMYVSPMPCEPPENDMQAAIKTGICSKIARKCGIKSATSSSTDFGMRMGRSFRVGWRPDGSFIHLSSKKNGVLVQSHPILCVQAPGLPKQSRVSNAVQSQTVPLLETHLTHKIRVSMIANGCPLFELPKSLVRRGTLLSYQALCKAIIEFAAAAKKNAPSINSDPEAALVVSRAFSLLSTLFGQEFDAFNVSQQNAAASLLAVDDSASTSELENDVSHCSERRREGLAAWFRDAVAYDMEHDITVAQQHNDIHFAIFSALSGGDRSRALDIAVKNGYLRLATLLANTGSQGASNMRDQIGFLHESGAASHIPSGLLRVYSLVSGDLGVEENIFKTGGARVERSLDWRRRLGMRLWCSSSVMEDDRLPLSDIINEYESDVVKGLAPYPSPRHMARADQINDTSRVQCLLYGLLQLRAGRGGRNGRVGASEIVSPDRHSRSPHDFSMAFHLAAALSALGCSAPLTPFEEARIVDSCVFQLINAGLWEWAVYVSLCSLGSAPAADVAHWRREKARAIVLRYFRSESQINSSMSRRRSFLENQVGVPSTWFEDALASRCAYNCDALGYVKHLAQISMTNALQAVEEAVLPIVLFKGSTEIKEFMRLLEALNIDETEASFCKIIYSFQRLSEEVFKLSHASRLERDQHSEHIRYLDLNAEKLQEKTASKKELGTITAVGVASPVYNKTERFVAKSVSKSILLAEISSALSLLRLQLKALQSGFSIIEDQRMNGNQQTAKVKVASQLAFLTAPNDDILDQGFVPISIGSESVLRGMI